MNPNANATIEINRPEPKQPRKNVVFYSSSSDIHDTIKAVEAGKYVLITELFSNGLILLKGLQDHLKSNLPNKSFQEQREFRSTYHKLSNQIILEIKDNKLVVKKAPFIGWLKKLYTDFSDFTLSLPQVQGLNSSWQWYKTGINIPVLRNKIHPYYGTYFPTRYDHLILFDNWLKRYEGVKKTSVDVGVGSGVLAFQLLKHGFQKVYGTDTSPNAIVGLVEFMGDTKLSRKIDVEHASLFGSFEKQTELIVFNPPWLPMDADSNRIDEAIYYSDNLFSEFFKESKKRLLPDGNLVILFSNLAKITNLAVEHPIEKELAEGVRFRLEKYLKKSVKSASTKTKREQHWRSEEEVELWVLKHI